MTLKHVHIIFSFRYTSVSGRNLTLFVGFSVQLCSSIMIGHWNPYWILTATVSLHNYNLWAMPDLLIFWDLVILMRSRGLIKKKSKSIANLCFCNQSDVRDEDTCLQLMKKHRLPTFVSGSFSHVSLWEIQFNSYPGANPVDLAWINLMHLNHSGLYFICEMRIVKARLGGSCKD